MIKSSNNLIGVTGEYYVCAELGRQGILALLTPKNNPLFDIVAVAPDGSRTVTIQVKTMSEGNKQGWKLGMDICERKDTKSLYTILVNLTGKEVEYYIYEYNVLSKKIEKNYADYLKIKKKDGGDRKDIAFRWHNLNQFTSDDHLRRNNWSVLGF
jgi:hypothetical protein